MNFHAWAGWFARAPRDRNDLRHAAQLPMPNMR
jgi:hypothetical protein